MAPGALAGVGVLITRPREQNEALAALIEQQGGRAYQVPAYEICAPADPSKLDALRQRLNEFDLVIFISTTAVAWGCALLNLASTRFSPNTRLGAVGAGTAAAMVKAGLPAPIAPATGFNSESLLAMPEFANVSNKKALVVRGEGGREVLANTLRQRGAQVEYAEVYRRQCPNIALDSELSEEDRQRIDVAVATSNEGLQNLYDMAGERLRAWLSTLPLIVMSERAVELARALGFKHTPRVVRLPGNDGILKTLIDWKNEN